MFMILLIYAYAGKQDFKITPKFTNLVSFQSVNDRNFFLYTFRFLRCGKHSKCGHVESEKMVALKSLTNRNLLSSLQM